MVNQNWRAKRYSLKEMINNLDGRIIVALGVAGGAEAKQLHHTIHSLKQNNKIPDFIGGFIFYASGYLCASRYGLPDLGYILRHEIVAQTDIIEQATWMAALDTGSPAYPIGVDIDTGYGNEPSSIILTCRQVHKQGGQYVQIEDQFAINKSCGHMAGPEGKGKKLISAEEMVQERLKPAVHFANQQEDFFVMARTDAIAKDGLDEAIRRGHLYAEAGAKMLFIEAPENEKQLEQIPRELTDIDALVLANMIEASPETPCKSPRQLHEMGFDIALYCVGPLLAARNTVSRYYRALCQGKSAMEELSEIKPDHWFADFNLVIGREQTEGWNQFFLGES